MGFPSNYSQHYCPKCGAHLSDVEADVQRGVMQYRPCGCEAPIFVPMTSTYVVVTTCGLGPEVDDTGPVYGPFASEEAAIHFASQLPDATGYPKGGSYWTDHQVFPLTPPSGGD